jgi:hypothetical protein
MRRLVGGPGGAELAGTTNNVTLCAGSVTPKLVPLGRTSARRVMLLVVGVHLPVVPRRVVAAIAVERAVQVVQLRSGGVRHAIDVGLIGRRLAAASTVMVIAL